MTNISRDFHLTLLSLLYVTTRSCDMPATQRMPSHGPTSQQKKTHTLAWSHVTFARNQHAQMKHHARKTQTRAPQSDSIPTLWRVTRASQVKCCFRQLQLRLTCLLNHGLPWRARQLERLGLFQVNSRHPWIIKQIATIPAIKSRLFMQFYL